MVAGTTGYAVRSRYEPPPLHDRVEEEALAALPGGTGPGALNGASTDDPGPPGNGGSRGRDTTNGVRGFFVSPAMAVPHQQHVREKLMPTIVVLGSGPLGRAVADAATNAGQDGRVLGRPTGARHDPTAFEGADLVVEASTANAVLGNITTALD